MAKRAKVDLLTIPHEPAPIPLIRPDKAIEKLFSESMAYLVFKWSLFAQMIYSGMEMVYTDDSAAVPIAATDSRAIFLNPKGFIDNKINDIPQVSFVLGHEVSHRVFNDLPLAKLFRTTGLCGVLPFVDHIYSVASDYRINGMLVHAGLGKMPKVGLYNKSISEKGMESIVEIYDKCYKLTERYGTVHIGISPSPKGFDIHLDPSDAQIAADKTAREHQIVSAAALSGRFGGSVPGAIQRVVGDILDPKVPWPQHIRAEMTRKAGDLELDWRKANRRLMGREPSLFYAAPGHKGCGPIVVVGDNSGSISKQYATMFASEMAAIVNDLRPSKLIVIWCDMAVTKYYELDDPEDLVDLFNEWKDSGVGGGGGTSFVPPFDRVRELELKPDVLVYFTDGMGTFPTEPPPYDVIWAMTTMRDPPFGETVRVELPS